jgi:hypothetical protein
MKRMKPEVEEADFMKALRDLESEAGISKGDSLENADTEGGLSTEGTAMSRKGKGKKSMNKADSMSDMGSDEDEASPEEADEASADDESSEPEMDKKVEQSMKRKSTRKSFYEDMEENETLQKGFEVSDVIQEFGSVLGEGVDELRGDLSTLEKSITVRLAKSQARQQGFNEKLAKGFVGMATKIREQGDQIDFLVKALSKVLNLPAPQAQRRSAVSMNDVAQPSLAKSMTGEGVDISGLSKGQIANWLFQKSQAKEIDPVVAINFEVSGYDINQLPPNLRKSLVSDFGLAQ